MASDVWFEWVSYMVVPYRAGQQFGGVGVGVPVGQRREMLERRQEVEDADDPLAAGPVVGDVVAVLEPGQAGGGPSVSRVCWTANRQWRTSVEPKPGVPRSRRPNSPAVLSRASLARLVARRASRPLARSIREPVLVGTHAALAVALQLRP